MDHNYPVEFTFSNSGKNRHLLDQYPKKDSFYIAVITKHYLKDDKCIGEAKDAGQLGIKMFGAIMECGRLPKEIRDLPWTELKAIKDSFQLAEWIKKLSKEN